MSQMRTSTTASPSALPKRGRQALILWSVRLLALAALAICGYLFLQTVALNELPVGCGAGSGCDAALNSRWSKWMGIPVSIPAAAVYFFLFVCAILVDPAFEPRTRRMAWRGIAFFAAIAAGAAVWFIFVQKIFVGSFCPWCSSAHLCGLVIAVLLILSSRAQMDTQSVAPRKRGRPRRLWPVALLAFPFVAALVAGQIRQSGRRILHVQAPSKDHLVFSEGTLELEWRDFPTLGSHDAPHTILIMADYTCPHCRRTHPSIEAVRKRYGNQISVVVDVVPMNHDCNPLIHQTAPVALHACGLARLALAVWRAKPDAFDEMDQWIFEQPATPTPEEARQHAVELIGETQLKSAEADPWVQQTLAKGIDLYRGAGGGVIPKIITQQTTLSGEIDEPSSLFQLLEKETGVKPIE